MESSLRERFARLGPVRAVGRVASGSPAVFVLAPRADLRAGGPDTVSAAVELARRGIPLLRAKRVLERMLAEGRAWVSLPMVEDAAALADALAAFGIEAAPFGPPDAVDVRAIRERLGLTQEEFAVRFGLGLDTVQNWESDRRQPDRTARSYLTAISRIPDRIQEALGPERG
jgi:DNA-binding XRE family transcriptional regulator